MADSGIFRLSHEVWQRSNVNAAAAYLREALARDPDDIRVKTLYEGLLEVLDPTRRMVRIQRELGKAMKSERRAGERRMGTDRRQQSIGDLGALDRRTGVDRRTGRDRRKRS